LDLLAFFNAGVIAEDDRPNIGLLQIQHETCHAAAEVEHLVTCVSQTFDLATPSPISRTTPMFCFTTELFAPAIWLSIS
jgi:hypothetical protein